MSDDPGNAEALDVEQPEVTVDQTQEQTETTSDTVSDSAEQHENKSTFTPEQKAAALASFEQREAKREVEALRKQLEEAQQPKSNDRPAVTELPEFPEPEEIREHIEATNRAAIWDHSQKQQQEADYQAQVTAQNQQAAASTKLRDDFVTTSTNAGIKLEDLQIAGNVVDSYGLSPQIAQAMMGDKDGGVVLLHLATDPASIQALNGANALTLGTIYADIKAKAAKLKPKQTEAPSPAEILDGNGAPPKQGGPPGATYE